MDEKLTQVLHKVELLCEQYPEFRQELCRRMGVENAGRQDDKTAKIEQYLGLDYSLDTADSMIGYSFVMSESVRNQLISDNREMMRYRYGTRGHTINFLEFCHYAMLQAEMLINYYYDTTYHSDIKTIKRVIMENNHMAESIKDKDSLLSITFNIKLWAFHNEFRLDNKNLNMELWNNIRTIRNDLSHRAPENEVQQDLLRFRQELETMGFPLTKNGEVNTYAIRSDEKKNEIYRTQLKNMPEYKNYCFALWLQRKDFDEVAWALDRFSKVIQERLIGAVYVERHR